MTYNLTLTSKINKHKETLVVVFVALLLRTIPEILAYPYPIGFDTMTYVAYYLDYHQQSLTHFLEGLINPQPILFAIMLYFFARYLFVPPLIFFKIFPILLYTFFVFSVYIYSTKKFGIYKKPAVYVSLIAGYHYTVLRLSWELYRNFLSFAFLLLFLTYYPPKNKKEIFLMFIFLFLTVTSHQLTTAILFLLVATIFLLTLKKELLELKLVNLVIMCITAIMLLYYIGVFTQLMNTNGNISLTPPGKY